MTAEKINQRRDAIEQTIIKHYGIINPWQKQFLDYAFSEDGTKDHLERYRNIFFS